MLCSLQEVALIGPCACVMKVGGKSGAVFPVVIEAV